MSELTAKWSESRERGAGALQMQGLQECNALCVCCKKCGSTSNEQAREKTELSQMGHNLLLQSCGARLVKQLLKFYMCKTLNAQE